MPNTFKLPLAKQPNVNFADLLVGMREMSFAQTIYYYIINSDTRRSVYLRSWFKDCYDEVTVQEICPQFIGRKADDALAKDLWRFVKQNIKYVGDSAVWKATEYWQTPLETWTLKTGDCEDGAILLASLMLQLGFDKNQVFIVAGDVKGGGHAYVDYISSTDGCDYTLDWCYWTTDSLKVMYGNNPNYFQGQKEWFRFNLTGTYVTT